MRRRSVLPVCVLLCLPAWGCGRASPDGSQENKALVTRFAEMVNTAQFDRLEEVVAPNFVRHSQATPDVVVHSSADFRKFLEENHAVFPDERMELIHMVAEEDKVAFWGRYTGTQQAPVGPFPATGKKMSLEVGGVFRVESGRLAELWITWDNMAALVQLGHVPPPAVPPE